MPLSATDQSKLTRFRYEHAALAFQSALLNLGMVLDHAYRPDQPRVPAGHPDGGQWTDGNDSGAPVTRYEYPVTRYEYNGRFVVRDDQTGEILQISDDGFKPNQPGE